MKLTPAERWILANQFRLMQMLSDRQIPLYAHAIEILESGYENHYGYAAQYLQEEPFPQNVVHEVEDILQMFEEMQWAAEKLSEDVILKHDWFEFEGFDSNTSHEHAIYTHFLHSLEKYPGIGNRLLYNPHSSHNLPVYRAMVKVWKGLPRKGLQMTRDDLQAILDAQQ